jgi:hypothetical protein
MHLVSFQVVVEEAKWRTGTLVPTSGYEASPGEVSGGHLRGPDVHIHQQVRIPLPLCCGSGRGGLAERGTEAYSVVMRCFLPPAWVVSEETPGDAGTLSTSLRWGAPATHNVSGGHVGPGWQWKKRNVSTEFPVMIPLRDKEKTNSFSGEGQVREFATELC